MWQRVWSGVFTQSPTQSAPEQIQKQDTGMLFLVKTSDSASELREAAVPLSEGEVELPYSSKLTSLPANYPRPMPYIV